MSDFFEKNLNNPEESSDDHVDHDVINENVNEMPESSFAEQMNVDDGESDSTYHYSFRNSDEEPEVENDAVYEKYQKRQEKKKARKNISRKLAKVAAYGLVFGLVAGAAFNGVNYGLERMGLNTKSTTQLASTQTVSTKSSNATNVSEVAQNALPAVVSITGTFQVESYGYFGNSSSESEGSGSGIIVAKDDNYIYSGYYLEIVNQNDEVIDCIGHKGYIVKLFENQSMVRLEEKMTPSKEFNPLNFVNIRAGVTSYLGNLNAPISLEELMSGPRLDESLYGNLPFANNGDGTGGYCQVNLKSLGDGDTTYFDFPSDSGVSSDDRVRYLLIDTPEVDHGPGGVDEEARGNEAKRVNNEKLTNATGIIVQSNKDYPLYETFGRMLGYVWYTNEDKNDLSSYRLLNFEMVLDGLAEFAESDLYETMYYKDVLYYDYLSYANDYAASLGLKIHGEKDPNFN